MSDPSGTDRGGEPGKHELEVDAIETDIARTREQLAATVDELTDRLDVKSRIKGRVEQTRHDATLRVQELRARATDAEGRPTPPVIAGAVAAAALVALAVWWRTRR
ncbi:DUF3618 domain-containing protein [Nocardioides sp. LHG3406-4]|uniref:DUF3618 domain-containing protein n=1 Tax=Nocardioides sp. LHG3406-4 TaxID=2804575 RepID=UPI003CE94AF1